MNGAEPMDEKISELVKKTPVAVGIILVTLALYIITGSLVFGALVVVEIAYFVWLEVKEGVEEHGWKHEVVDTIIAILIAVILWVGASVILNTSTPISAVASCSMLPNLEKGEFIIIQGTDITAYDISLSSGELDSLTSGPFIAVTDEGEMFTLPMPMYSYCNAYRSEPVCTAFLADPESVVEMVGPFTYHYTMCGVDYRDTGARGLGRCLEYIEYEDREYYTNTSNDIIVYETGENDLYRYVVPGDIVHRAFFRINVDGEYYYLTKGDNNPTLDIQAANPEKPFLRNSPVPDEKVRGKVIGRVPYLGYLKLLIMGQWGDDPQCGWQMSHAAVN